MYTCSLFTVCLSQNVSPVKRLSSSLYYIDTGCKTSPALGFLCKYDVPKVWNTLSIVNSTVYTLSRMCRSRLLHSHHCKTKHVDCLRKSFYVCSSVTFLHSLLYRRVCTHVVKESSCYWTIVGCQLIVVISFIEIPQNQLA